MKPPRLKNHLTTLQPDKTGKPIAFFQALNQRQTLSSISKVFAKSTCQNVKELLASYKAVFLIAKSYLPFSVGESLVVTAMKEIISTVMERNPAPVLQTVPLSDTTVKRRIDKMRRILKINSVKSYETLLSVYNWMKPPHQTITLY